MHIFSCLFCWCFTLLPRGTKPDDREQALLTGRAIEEGGRGGASGTGGRRFPPPGPATRPIRQSRGGSVPSSHCSRCLQAACPRRCRSLRRNPPWCGSTARSARARQVGDGAPPGPRGGPAASHAWLVAAPAPPCRRGTRSECVFTNGETFPPGDGQLGCPCPPLLAPPSLPPPPPLRQCPCAKQGAGTQRSMHVLMSHRRPALSCRVFFFCRCPPPRALQQGQGGVLVGAGGAIPPEWG